MLFITNRFPKGSLDQTPKPGAARKPFIFHPKNNTPANSVFFCEIDDDGSTYEVGGMNFMSRLRASDYRQVLLYIHGFSNQPGDVFRNAREFQALCDASDKKTQDREKKAGVVVVPVIWPCDDDLGIVKDYWDDQKSADGSAQAFSRALSIFLKWRESEANEPEVAPCLKRINVLAHSMGNRVLREALCAWNRYDLPDGLPLIFRNTFLVAADIENESIHRGERGQLICDASRNVVVYFASDDLALRASKASNLKNKIASRRLGHTGPENMDLAPKNVYVVDCDDVNNDYDPPKGHSYFRSGRTPGQPGVVFDHIHACLREGRVFPQDEFKRSTILREA